MLLKQKHQRLFFALWPDQSVRDLIQARTQARVEASGGRRIAAVNYHITLLFMGNVGPAELEQAQLSASALRSPVVDLSLDCIESPRRTAVAWLSSTQCSAALMALVQTLRAGNAAVPTGLSFRPHVTLARDPVRCLPSVMIEPVAWPARDFVLVSSVVGGAGSQYTIIGRWPLQAAW